MFFYFCEPPQFALAMIATRQAIKDYNLFATLTRKSFGNLKFPTQISSGPEGAQPDSRRKRGFYLKGGLLSGRFKRGVTERGGLPVHCLSVRPDRQQYCHINPTSPPC